MKHLLLYIVSYKYFNLTCLTTKMTTAFAVITGLPEYNKKRDRANLFNVNLGDVITYKTNGLMIFSVVKGTTTTAIQVDDLICENTIDGVYLYRNMKQNITTKGLLTSSRKMFKVRNIHRL